MNLKKIRENISINEWSYCLILSRNGRALILRDSESFHEAVTMLEQIGKALSGKIRNGLGGYMDVLLELMGMSGSDTTDENERLLNVVKEARNMAVHEGSFARHLSSRLIDLFLILEEAIMTKLEHVEDIMVRNPTVVEGWQMVANARREMLANSFTFLPILHDGKWQLIADFEVMHFLRSSSDLSKNDRLSMSLGTSINKKSIHLIPVRTCNPSDTISDLTKIIENLPVLVIKEFDGEKKLLGIVTPFDLL